MEIIHELFLRIYILPIPKLILLVGASSLIFLFVHQAAKRFVLWKWLLGLALILWGIAVLYSTVSGRDSGSIGNHAWIPFHSYREVLNGGNPEILRSNFMNILMFFPAGLLFFLLLPEERPRWQRIGAALVLFILLSAGIECAQYAFTLGRAEIDDVIHNALGAFLGCLCALLSPQPKNVHKSTE